MQIIPSHHHPYQGVEAWSRTPIPRRLGHCNTIHNTIHTNNNNNVGCISNNIQTHRHSLDRNSLYSANILGTTVENNNVNNANNNNNIPTTVTDSLPPCLQYIMNNGEERTMTYRASHRVGGTYTVPRQQQAYNNIPYTDCKSNNNNNNNNNNINNRNTFTTVYCCSQTHTYGLSNKYKQLSAVHHCDNDNDIYNNSHDNTYNNNTWVEHQRVLYRQHKERMRHIIDQKDFYLQFHHHVSGDMYNNNNNNNGSMEQDGPTVMNRASLPSSSKHLDNNITSMNRLYFIRSLLAEGARRDMVSITEMRECQLYLEDRYNKLLLSHESMSDVHTSDNNGSTNNGSNSSTTVLMSIAMERERFHKKCAQTLESYNRAVKMHRLYWTHVGEDVNAHLASDQPGVQEAMVSILSDSNGHHNVDRTTTLAQAFSPHKPISYDSYTMAKGRISHRHIWRRPVASCYQQSILKHAARYLQDPYREIPYRASTFAPCLATGRFGDSVGGQSQTKALGGIYNGLICEAESIRMPHSKYEAWKQRQLSVLNRLPVIILPNNKVSRLLFLQYSDEGGCMNTITTTTPSNLLCNISIYGGTSGSPPMHEVLGHNDQYIDTDSTTHVPISPIRIDLHNTYYCDIPRAGALTNYNNNNNNNNEGYGNPLEHIDVVLDDDNTNTSTSSTVHHYTYSDITYKMSYGPSQESTPKSQVGLKQ